MLDMSIWLYSDFSVQNQTSGYTSGSRTSETGGQILAEMF